MTLTYNDALQNFDQHISQVIPFHLQWYFVQLKFSAIIVLENDFMTTFFGWMYAGMYPEMAIFQFYWLVNNSNWAYESERYKNTTSRYSVTHTIVNISSWIDIHIIIMIHPLDWLKIEINTLAEFCYWK